MALDSFEQKSVQTEQDQLESVKSQLNKSFSGVWDKNSSHIDSKMASPENVLLMMESDSLRAERLNQTFKEVDRFFTADRITCPNDARDLPFSTIEELIKDMPIEDACAIGSYFLSNKIALSSPMTYENLSTFKDSAERAKMVEEVREVLSKNGSWSQWVEELGEHANNAGSALTELTADAAGVVSDMGANIREGAAVVAENVTAVATDAYQNLEDGAAFIAENIATAAEEARENFDAGVEVIAETTAEAAAVASEVGQATAEVVVDSAEAVCYVTQRTAVGGVRFVENCSDYIDATVNTLMGKEDLALDTVQTSVADELSARIDEYYNPSETLRSIGDAAENVGEIATGVGLTVAAIANVPQTATIMGSAVAANAVAGAAVTLVGLNAAGRSLDFAVEKTGEIGYREITAATVAGVATAGATAVAGVVNAQIPGYMAERVAEHAVANNITLQTGGRLVGVLSSSAIAAADVGLFRTAEMASDITNVALGIEDDYDVVQEIGETVVSVAGAAALAGVGYDVMRTIQGSNLFRNVFHTPEYVDYFDHVYRSELGNYAREITIHIPENWTEEQIAQAQAKIDALNEAAQNGELARTPVERSGTASSRYRSEYGADSIPDGMDVDHTIELQLGGADDISNMNPIDRSVNRSFGSQINNQISDIPYGTPITRVSLA